MKQQGIGFFGILGLIFITLKLLAIAPVAGWSWWLALLPLYGGIVLVAGIAFLVFIFYAVFALAEKARENTRKL